MGNPESSKLKKPGTAKHLGNRELKPSKCRNMERQKFKKPGAEAIKMEKPGAAKIKKPGAEAIKMEKHGAVKI